MHFNSSSYLLFLICAVACSTLIGQRLKLQHLWLLFASLFFYGFWNPYYISLLFFCAFSNYLWTPFLLKECQYRKRNITLCIIWNLSILFFFKYLSFFIENFNTLFFKLGMNISIHDPKIILPVGISFFYLSSHELFD